MEQDGRPEVEASVRRRGKGDEACSVASREGSKVRRRRRGLGGVGGLFFRLRKRVARGGMRWIGPIGSPWDNPWVITH
jgi:hypothetical protein